jgi:hypothetical protein
VDELSEAESTTVPRRVQIERGSLRAELALIRH